MLSAFKSNYRKMSIILTEISRLIRDYIRYCSFVLINFFTKFLTTLSITGLAISRSNSSVCLKYEFVAFFLFLRFQAAQKLVGREHVYRAIDLVEYDPHLKPAMEFIFGNSLICTDSNVAKKVRTQSQN